MFGSSVGLDFRTQMEAQVAVTKEPAKVGDPLAICGGEEISFTPRVGPAKGKNVVVKGLFEGKYCGVRQ